MFGNYGLFTAGKTVVTARLGMRYQLSAIYYSLHLSALERRAKWTTASVWVASEVLLPENKLSQPLLSAATRPPPDIWGRINQSIHNQLSLDSKPAAGSGSARPPRIPQSLGFKVRGLSSDVLEPSKISSTKQNLSEWCVAHAVCLTFRVHGKVSIRAQTRRTLKKGGSINQLSKPLRSHTPNTTLTL